MFDLVRFIFADGMVSEIRVELALTVLRYSGRGLRAECPDDFRDMLAFVTDAASAARTSGVAPEGSEVRSRVEFLLRELQDLKNNKVSFAAMDRFDAIRTWLRTAPVLSNKKVGDHQLAVPFKYLKEEAPANWPVISTPAGGAVISKKRSSIAGSGPDPLRAAAVAQRLTTDLRQNLFVALMGAEDFEHATDRVCQVAMSAKIGIADACLV